MKIEKLTQQHNLFNSWVFQLKIIGLILKRYCKNLKDPVQKFEKKANLVAEESISFSESELWNPDDNSENWVLTAGENSKFENCSSKNKRT